MHIQKRRPLNSTKDKVIFVVISAQPKDWSGSQVFQRLLAIKNVHTANLYIDDLICL
jgi:hypothetical protein